MMLPNQIIKIYSFQDTDDGAGGSYPMEVLYWETSAKVKVLKSRRDLQANQEALKPAMIFTLNYRDDKFVTVDMQLKYRGEYFTIQTAEPDYVFQESLVIIARAVQLPVR